MSLSSAVLLFSKIEELRYALNGSLRRFEAICHPFFEQVTMSLDCIDIRKLSNHSCCCLFFFVVSKIDHYYHNHYSGFCMSCLDGLFLSVFPSSIKIH